ncbi:MAG TPA: efflux RND transporter periplasmic adaptor subunit [Sedimentisphaerales bacterium]|nr:efflux RND transporter periplasmic adaptor subunit [Sedimentisphaerales bacterium]
MNRKRLLSTCWKTALVLLIASIIVYRIHFAPVAVQSCAVKTGPISAEAMGTGTLEARVRATIGPKISGRIAQVLVDQGDKVIKGQKLVLLDDEDLRQQVEIAKAELSVAHAGVEKAVSGIKSAEATEKEAKASYARISQLAPSGAVSVDALEKSQQQMEVAQAELNRAQTAKIEAEKLVIKAEASLEFAQAQLSYTVICSPFDGLIVKRNREPGDVVVPGSMVLDMISLDELWISAWIDETLLNQLEVGQASKVVFRSDPTIELPGKVVRIAPQADRETREVLVDVGIDRMPDIWAVGQRAEVYVETARKENVFVIPQRVVVWRQQESGVFVIDNGRAYWRKIVTGIEGKENVEVVKGLQPDQTVLIPGIKLPRDGRAVKVITK